MRAEQATDQSPQFELPKDLVLEMQRRGAPRRHDFAVESWKPSMLERLIALLTGRK